HSANSFVVLDVLGGGVSCSCGGSAGASGSAMVGGVDVYCSNSAGTSSCGWDGSSYMNKSSC
ncbi:MAG: hypothetical protein ACKPKO_30845, partial [Candidatus Fonsibacter sp.]